MPTGPTPLDKTPPGSNQHPLSSKEEARASDKEKPRVEDGGLDGVAARTAPEHVAVKQEPHIPSVSGAVPCLTWLGGKLGGHSSLLLEPILLGAALGSSKLFLEEVAVLLSELTELGTAVVQVGDGVVAPDRPCLRGALVSQVPAVFPKTPSAQHPHTQLCFDSPNRPAWCPR